MDLMDLNVCYDHIVMLVLESAIKEASLSVQPTYTNYNCA